MADSLLSERPLNEARTTGQGMPVFGTRPRRLAAAHSSREMRDLGDADDVAFAGHGSAVSTDGLVLPIRPPMLPRLASGMVLQKWEGQVQSLTSDGFVASLLDLTTEGVLEEAEFGIEEISDADRELIRPGAVFYWSIGYKDALTGQRSRESIIRFRRLPTWNKQDRAEARQRAEGWRSVLEPE